MAFVADKCPACGVEIQLDDTRETGFCQYCGTKILREEAMSIEIVVGGSSTLETKLKNAEAYIKMREYKKAKATYDEITEEYVSDYRAWWGLAKLDCGESFYGDSIEGCCIDRIEYTVGYQNAMLVADDAEKERVEKEYAPYKARVAKARENVDATIKRIAAGEYALINHAVSAVFTSGGFEIYDGNLYYWDEYASLGTCALLFKKVESIGQDGAMRLDDENDLISECKIDYVDDKRLMLSKISKYAEDTDSPNLLYKFVIDHKILPSRPERIRRLSPSAKTPDPGINRSSGGCYIATAVYGSYDAPQVMALRRYRDRVLMRSRLGRLFIQFYYKLSPSVADRLRHVGRANRAVRAVLDRWVRHLEAKSQGKDGV